MGSSQSTESDIVRGNLHGRHWTGVFHDKPFAFYNFHDDNYIHNMVIKYAGDVYKFTELDTNHPNGECFNAYMHTLKRISESPHKNIEIDEICIIMNKCMKQ